MKKVQPADRSSIAAWPETAFSALHDLSLDIGADVTPEQIARWARSVLLVVIPGRLTGVWWLEGDAADVIAGDPPPALKHLPGYIPETLCLVHHGQLIPAQFFGVADTVWQFIPITDRATLFGWIGLEPGTLALPDGFIPFLCTLGAMLGQAVRRQQLNHQRVEAERREAILSRYLSPTMVQAVVANANLNRHVRKASVLTLDLRQSTARVFAEDHHTLLHEMNAFFERMVQVVFEQSGIVDKLLGDGLIAEFGILAEEPPHASRRAILAAQAMIRATRQYNLENRPQTPFVINIGVATGPLHISHLGGHGFFDLTVLGRPINLAARLEDEAQTLNVDIAIDHATFEALGRTDDWCCFRNRILRGLPTPIDVWGQTVSK